MLKAIELENFKAFGQRTRIELAPITLIFGQNSAGKSSILQSLSLLKQTRESRELGAPLLPRAEQGLVDLGSFQELLFDHDLGRLLCIGLELTPERRLGHFLRRMTGARFPSSLGWNAFFSRPSAEDEIEVSKLELKWDQLEEPLAVFRTQSLTENEQREAMRVFWGPIRARRPAKRSKIKGARCVSVSKQPGLWEPYFGVWLSRRRELVDRLKERRNKIAHHQPTIFEPDEAADLVVSEESLRWVDEAIAFYSEDFTFEQFVARMVKGAESLVIALDGFLPSGPRPIRSSKLPEIYILDRRLPGREEEFPILDIPFAASGVGRAVEESLESLFPMGPFRRPPERWYIFTGTSPEDVGYKGDLLPDLLFRRPELVERANEWLARLDIKYELDVRPVGKRTTDLFEVRLVDAARAKKVDVGLSDVGFGISQILPFIVQCLASERQTISIEQPEVHIHPRLQADLGELIATSIAEPYSHQFLIETHSEHLILRFQKLVREKRLKPEQISVIFVSREPEGSRAMRLHLDESGRFIDEWPGGFFAERLRELR